ncbi:hypothetical protein [Egbenema bharatensis]|uniref:hypothetical protein n=1 Tax=Egbenema bharatensis TaxID=3463334 RepID=UPI003A89E2A1
MNANVMNANWTTPSPRTGLKGLLDRFTGPGATPAELIIQFVPPFIAALTAPLYAIMAHLHWTPSQLVVAAVLALDLVGGIITNATASAKRWYHRPGQGFWQHMSFISLHVLHVLLVVLLFRSEDRLFFVVVSAYLLSAAFLILQAPLYLQRPIALGLYTLALLGDRYLFAPTLGLEWFLPCFFLKVLVSHLLKEQPYRP